MPPDDPDLRLLLRRGWRKRCPRCGQGPLFRTWFRLHAACSECGLRLQPRPGDSWGFWLIGDRIFVAGPMILLFIGFTPESWWLRGVFIGTVTLIFVLTMPRRMGLCVALDYLSRLRLGE